MRTRICIYIELELPVNLIFRRSKLAAYCRYVPKLEEQLTSFIKWHDEKYLHNKGSFHIISDTGRSKPQFNCEFVEISPSATCEWLMGRSDVQILCLFFPFIVLCFLPFSTSHKTQHHNNAILSEYTVYKSCFIKTLQTDSHVVASCSSREAGDETCECKSTINALWAICHNMNCTQRNVISANYLTLWSRVL
jgi:hypothetical protein